MGDAEILTQLDAAILSVVTAIASGQRIVEYMVGGVRIRKEPSADLLKSLRDARSEFKPAAETDRSAGICTFGGAQ